MIPKKVAKCRGILAGSPDRPCGVREELTLVRSTLPAYTRVNVALTPGTRLGVYEITAQIGEGAMGQVYRATDTAVATAREHHRARLPMAHGIAFSLTAAVEASSPPGAGGRSDLRDCSLLRRLVSRTWRELECQSS